MVGRIVAVTVTVAVATGAARWFGWMRSASGAVMAVGRVGRVARRSGSGSIASVSVNGSGNSEALLALLQPFGSLEAAASNGGSGFGRALVGRRLGLDVGLDRRLVQSDWEDVTGQRKPTK